MCIPVSLRVCVVPILTVNNRFDMFNLILSLSALSPLGSIPKTLRKQNHKTAKNMSIPKK